MAISVKVEKTRLAKSVGVMRTVSKFAVRGLLEDIANDARMLVPVDEGDLKASIRHEIDPTGLGGSVIADQPYASSVEFGANPHTIEPKEAEFLHFFVDGVEIFTKRVDHPGQTAQPFLRPALEKNRGVFSEGRAIGREFLRRLRGK